MFWWCLAALVVVGSSFGRTQTTTGCPTVVLYGSTTVQVSEMTSYTMTGDTREGRPVYYSNATCDFLYYKCGDYLQWCVGPQVGGGYRSVYVRDSHLYADEINGTFFLWDGQWIENSDVKIACSDDVPAGVVVPQPVSSTTDCTRVRLQGNATYQTSRMTTYTRTNQTSSGRPVYVSDRDSRNFVFFVDEYNQWWVGTTIGQARGGVYVYDCAMTPDQTRPVWYLYDGSQWRFVPSVKATCVGNPALESFQYLEQMEFPTLRHVDPDGDAVTILTLQACAEKCLSLGDSCLAFQWPRGNYKFCFLFDRVETPENIDDINLYIKIVPTTEQPALLTQTPGGATQQTQTSRPGLTESQVTTVSTGTTAADGQAKGISVSVVIAIVSVLSVMVLLAFLCTGVAVHFLIKKRGAEEPGTSYHLYDMVGPGTSNDEYEMVDTRESRRPTRSPQAPATVPPPPGASGTRPDSGYQALDPRTMWNTASEYTSLTTDQNHSNDPDYENDPEYEDTVID